MSIETKALQKKQNVFSVSKTTKLVIVICWLAIFIEGYDLVVYGVVLPVLMTPEEWGISAGLAGSMGSYALLGMFIGSTIGGILSDKIGRKNVLIFSLIFLSVLMALTAMASSPTEFAIYRFIAGIGIGGLVPATAALTTEYSPMKYRSLMFVIMYSGFAFGGVCASISGMLFMDTLGWRSLFWLGVIPFLLVPIIIMILPESLQYLKVKNREAEIERVIHKYKIDFTLEDEPGSASNGIKDVFTKKYIVPTILFSMIYIMAFLLIYGMNTWLPKIMEQAGYPMTSSMAFLLIFNLGAIFGGLLAGNIADKMEPKYVISMTYSLAMLSIFLLSFKLHIGLLYLLIAIAGFGTTGTTFVLASFVMKYYDANNRATALGFTSAVGRFGAVAGPILVGIIMTMELNYKYNFYLFAIIALLAACVPLFIPKK